MYIGAIRAGFYSCPIFLIIFLGPEFTYQQKHLYLEARLLAQACMPRKHVYSDLRSKYQENAFAI
jgi:hypothetical protein